MPQENPLLPVLVWDCSTRLHHSSKKMHHSQNVFTEIVTIKQALNHTEI